MHSIRPTTLYESKMISDSKVNAMEFKIHRTLWDLKVIQHIGMECSLKCSNTRLISNTK